MFAVTNNESACIQELQTWGLITKKWITFILLYRCSNRWQAYLICNLIGSHCDVLHWHVCHLAAVQVCRPSCGLKLYALGSEVQRQEVKVQRPFSNTHTHKDAHGNLPPGILRNYIIIIQPHVAQIIIIINLWNSRKYYNCLFFRVSKKSNKSKCEF